jgi:hypothetical protein
MKGFLMRDSSLRILLDHSKDVQNRAKMPDVKGTGITPGKKRPEPDLAAACRGNRTTNGTHP